MPWLTATYSKAITQDSTGPKSGSKRLRRGLINSNRAKASAGWPPFNGVTVDIYGNLLTNTNVNQTTTPAQLGAISRIGPDNGEDNWGVPCDLAGTWLIRFTIPVTASSPLTGTTSTSSPIVLMASTTDIVAGMSVAGTGITAGTTVLSLVATTSVTLSSGIRPANGGSADAVFRWQPVRFSFRCPIPGSSPPQGPLVPVARQEWPGTMKGRRSNSRSPSPNPSRRTRFIRPTSL